MCPNYYYYYSKLQSAFLVISTTPVSKCCSIKLPLYILVEKYIYILALEMASYGTSTVPIASAHFRFLFV